MQYKTILALDCATGPCSASIWKDGAVAGYVEDLRPVVQSARMLPMIEEVLGASGVSYQDLDAVACTTGPGSFTGIRIGLATAQGIAYAAKIPGIGFTTLEVMAHGIRHRHDSIFSVLNAGKGEWYRQLFTTRPTWQALDTAALASPEKASHSACSDAVWVGNVDAQNITKAFPRADWLATLAAESNTATPLIPFYIRPPDITMPKIKK